MIWLSFDTVKFFGYQVSARKYEIDTELKMEMQAFSMPTNQKQIQRFLGAALLFKNFIPDF